MALDADIICADKVELLRIYDIGWRSVGYVGAAWAVALFAPDIPLRDLLGVNVIVDGVAAVAGWSGGAIEIRGPVEGDPPVCASFHVIREPLLLRNIPLRGQWEVIVAAFCEVALLETAAIDESDIIDRKGANGIGMREVADDGVWTLTRVEEDVGHPAFLPAVVLGQMACFAGFGADVMRLLLRGCAL